jgi:hypothetical protein
MREAEEDMTLLVTAQTPESERRLDVITLALAALLFISPWMMNFADLAVAAWAAWISAVVIGIVSLAATIHFAEWEEWVNLVGGVWLLAAPWLLHFSRDGDAVAAFTGIAAFIVVVSASELWSEHHPLGVAKI